MATQSGIAEAFVSFDASYDRLTSRNAAMLLIDHQIGPLWELEFGGMRRTLGELARRARRLGVPTVITAIAPEIWGSVIPELASVVPDAPTIVRGAVNPWEESRVRRAVESAKRRKLLIAGGAGEDAVTSCALCAANSGYDVYVLLDASPELGHAAIARLGRAGVIVTTISLVAAEMGSEL
jgi:nicotinamidase-related amidase